MSKLVFPTPVDLTGAALNIVDGFVYALYTDRPFYMPGQPVHIMFVKTNISPQAIRLVYPNSPRFDLAVVQNDREIWRWSRDQVSLPIVNVCEILPGQSEMFYVVWEQNSNNEIGTQVGPGLFNLRAFNTAAELQNKFVDLRLRIQPAAPETNNNNNNL